MNLSRYDFSEDSPLQRAITMNNKAAGLMMVGRYAQGIRGFQGAIQALKEASLSSAPYNVDQLVVSSPALESAARIMKPCINGLLQVQEQGYVYDHHFLLEVQQSDSVDNDTILAIYSSAILFNFGLALHADGIRSGKNGALNKALYVYEMACHLLRPYAACESFAAVIAVILNNEARIHGERGDFRAAEHLFSDLSVILHSTYVQLCNVLTISVVDELYLNILVCQSPYASQAA